MDMMNEMLKNPQMMEQINEMMKNPEMMSQMNEMMKNPEMLSNIMNSMKPENPDGSNPISNQLYNIDDKIKTKDLTNDTYNNKIGKVVSYDKIKERYLILLDDDKNISIKEKNIELID